MALYSGIVKVGADGTADVAFDIADFAGTVRVMAVGWSKGKVGHGTADVTVRDPVVLTATLPRFLLPGDRSSVHLDLDNVEGAAGEYTIAVTSADALSATSNLKLALRAKERGAANVPLTAAAAGNGTVRISVSGPGGFALQRSYALTVRPPGRVMARRTVKPLAKGESLAVSGDMFADLVPGTGAVSLSIGSLASFDAAGLLAALDRYPFRCSEQITSRSLPLLYLSDLAKDSPIAADPATDQKLREAIETLLTRQDSNGSFGLWSVGGDDVWLDSYVTDFLTRARERKIPVPEAAFKLALDRLRNAVANTADASKNGGDRSRLRALRAGAERRRADRRSSLHRRRKARCVVDADRQSAIAAALAMVGDRTRAERVYAAALEALAPSALKYARVTARRLRLDLARRGGAGRAGERRRCAARHRAGRGAARRGGAFATCARPRPRKMRGFCSRRARWLRTAARCRSTSAARR